MNMNELDKLAGPAAVAERDRDEAYSFIVALAAIIVFAIVHTVFRVNDLLLIVGCVIAVMISAAIYALRKP
jgi:hypothetical protein